MAFEDMEIEEFRRQAHAFADWMADYLAGVEAYPVRAQVAPGEIAAKLPAAAPERGEPMEAIFKDFQDLVLPGMTHWQHPSFFAYFPANSSPPSVLAEMLTATLARPVHALADLAGGHRDGNPHDGLAAPDDRPARGLPGRDPGFGLQRHLCALLTAREKGDRLAGQRGRPGALGRRAELAVYCSEEAHSSIEKDVMIAGLRPRGLRKIAADDDFAMRPRPWPTPSPPTGPPASRRPAWWPLWARTGTGGVDPLPPIGALCRRAGVWLHVDAAWAGSALILPEQRWMIEGIEAGRLLRLQPAQVAADQLRLLRPFRARRRGPAAHLSDQPTYLKPPRRREVIDYRDWGVPLGRRFRALKLWFVIRSYGVEGLRAMIADHIAWTAELAARCRRRPTSRSPRRPPSPSFPSATGHGAWTTRPGSTPSTRRC